MHEYTWTYTSSAADLGHTDGLSGGGNTAGACAQGILNSFTIRWLIIASTPANRSTPCNEISVKNINDEKCKNILYLGNAENERYAC
jgi:hypothetical protein